MNFIMYLFVPMLCRLFIWFCILLSKVLTPLFSYSLTSFQTLRYVGDVEYWKLKDTANYKQVFFGNLAAA